MNTKESIKNGAVILDVRSPDEFASGAYPGAINIPISQLASRLGEWGGKDKPLVVYCASGGRSAIATSILSASGYLSVINAGGLFDMPA